MVIFASITFIILAKVMANFKHLRFSHKSLDLPSMSVMSLSHFGLDSGSVFGLMA